MKYSMNYYSKRKWKFNEIHVLEPNISETISSKEGIKESARSTEKRSNDFMYVVPWQLP